MSTTWKFHADAGLTVPLTTRGATIAHGLGPTDAVVYLGSSAAGKTLRAASAPGVAAIAVEVDATGAVGITAAALSLALSVGGLASATPGAALTLPAVLSSGAGGAVAIYVRTAQGALAQALYAGLKLRTVPVVES
ncbi:MAG: hypothetical protein CVU28_08090 [Betaproteobacteria bacterium HGW-Betaproteobacteria-21]|nr:MAG: hypothetical protein CVU28_08090 [Betaproteobacteria bacterium HGW-Betaproteobacteria-21]